MPTTPTYPGVYIEEVPSGVHTITGVATSIAAFLGRTSKGPLNKAIRCFNYSDFERVFGKPHPNSSLADSVRMFFTNGGSECYVVRLAKTAAKASVTLKSLEEVDVLLATAKAEGCWANTVRLEVDYNTPNPDESFNLRVIQEEGGREVAREEHTNLSMNQTSPRFAPAFVTQSSDLIDLELAIPESDLNEITNSFIGFSQARRPLGDANSVKSLLSTLIAAGKTKFEISVDGSSFIPVDLKDVDCNVSVNTIGQKIGETINDAIRAEDPSLIVSSTLAPQNNYKLTISSVDGTDKPGVSVHIRRASSNDISAALMLGVDQGGIEPTRFSNFRPAPNGTFLNLWDTPTPSNRTDLDTINEIADLTQEEITSVEISGTPITLNLITTSGTEKWYKDESTDADHAGNNGVREKMGIIAKAINDSADLTCKAEVWGYHLVIIPQEGTINNQLSVEANDSPQSVVKFNNGIVSNVRQYTLGMSGSGGFSTGVDDGDDGTFPEKAEYVGSEADHTGFHALDKVDLFNLMVLPEDDEVDLTTIWGPASVYCQKHRAFLLIDSPHDWAKDGLPAVVQDTNLVGNLRATVVKENSAVFYPRLKYAANGLKKKIGASGALAGLMARIDSTRGVWKAPAGTEADVRGILGLDVKLTDPENGVLNKLAVNCIRQFPGTFVNWGARTMDGADDIGSEWKYIPIRRLTLFIEESLYRGTKWVVFEPNDEPLWAKIRLNVGAFMARLFKQGAFQGSTPDKAFFVKCDGETTTEADRNLGIVNILVGFAPLKPAEFVIIKIQQIAGEL